VAKLKAAIFDIGGVLTSSPVAAIRRYAEGAGVDYAVLGPMIAHHDLAWSRWERSELSQAAFFEAFEAEAVERGIAISAAAVMEAAFGTQIVRPEMVAVVEHLRGKVRLGSITNNVIREADAPTRPATVDLFALFEVVIESARAGIRKPDPRIYRMVCEALEVEPEDAVFLDDIGVNLKGARALGMTTIKVDESTRAIDELEEALGIPLPRPREA
jgi:putative hydrolase of the HAD superfamily